MLPDYSVIHQSAPIIMGIVNVTPDSFSDGGQFIDPQRAVLHAQSLMDEGAAILDIGGESTRPGAAPVDVAEEAARVIPVLHKLVPMAHARGVLVSVDTRRAAVMQAALTAGADMINDVSALEDDPDSLATVASSACLVCLMHKQGQPGTMQLAPVYNDVVEEVLAYLQARVQACLDASIAPNRIVIDPGIGFGKTTAHNIALLRHLDRFAGLGVPVLLGASRKKFIADLAGDAAAADQRLGGSIAAVIAGYQRGARIFRVHDVAATRQALAVVAAISS